MGGAQVVPLGRAPAAAPPGQRRLTSGASDTPRLTGEAAVSATWLQGVGTPEPNMLSPQSADPDRPVMSPGGNRLSNVSN
jgi:hypothetical protein